MLTGLLMILIANPLDLGRDGGNAQGEVPAVEQVGETIIEHRTMNFTERTIIFNGNITIGAGGNLTIDRSEVQMNSTNISRFSITVLQGGRLDIIDSSIGQNGTFGYDFFVNGTMTMENGTVTGMISPDRFGDSGIYIRSNDAQISNSTIVHRGYLSKSITANGSSPTVWNSVLQADYFGAFLVNGSVPVFRNTSFLTSASQSAGILCNDSGFVVESCNFSRCYYGIDIRSGDPGLEGTVMDSTFYRNQAGAILTEGSGMTPEFSSCIFLQNELVALYIYGNVTIRDCLFEQNVIPGPINPVAAVVLNRSVDHGSVSITNSTFLNNHNGILSWGVDLTVHSCTFDNNSWYGGSNGITIFTAQDTTWTSIENSVLINNPTAVEVGLGDENASISISGNEISESTTGFFIWNSTLEIRDNIIDDCETGVEERYREGVTMKDNVITNTSVIYRYMVLLNVHVADGYGIDLGKAKIQVMPTGDTIRTPEQYPLDGETSNLGRASIHIIWKEIIPAIGTIQYSPYTVTCTYEGVSGTNTVSTSQPFIDVDIILPYLRPDLVIQDLEVAYRGFSVSGNEPRKNEDARIEFTIRNDGEGRSNDSEVIVREGIKEIYRRTFSLDAGGEREFEFSWTPRYEGKVNISVRVIDSNELNESQNSLSAMIDVGEEQRGYFYVSILLTVLIILGLILWMAGNIEGANKDMAEFSRNMKKWLSGLFESWSQKLTVEEDEDMGSNDGPLVIPSGEIYSWDGESALSGSGKFTPWSMEDENLIRIRKSDVMEVKIKIPLPEPEIIDDVPEMETFEWMSALGKKETIKVDKRTISKISHPKMFICALCDRNFVSVEPAAKCPWCSGKAYFLQDM